MKTHYYLLTMAVLSVATVPAQEAPRLVRGLDRSSTASAQLSTNTSAGFASDLAVVHDAQSQALAQAREMLEGGGNVRDRSALETAVKEMERAQSALAEAKNSPEKLATALAAEQAAYQTLLKVVPREYNLTRSQRGSQSGGQSQSQQRQLNQLDLQREENRYETERQATAPPNAQQREQLQTADRLKELSQRQQDLNERLRELQTALQAANTDQEREELQRQLKRLQDEQRQMLAVVDELRQKLEQSPNASAQAETQKQLEQTHADMERAAQEMERQSASGALAAGTRAQERMQNLRDDLRKQTSSEFSEQMRQLREQARELSKQQEKIGTALDMLGNGERQALDNTAERRQLAEQLAQQQGSLTNLLSQMRRVTELAEATEPLLSKQLYDTLRRTDQARTENLLQMGAELTERGFLPQASRVERAARTNITDLARSVERAAESVLGSEADALRYAQKSLDELTRQVERELGAADTNAATLSVQAGTNSTGRLAAGNSNSAPGTNATAQARELSAANGSPTSENGLQGQRSGEGTSAGTGQNQSRGEPASGENSQNGIGDATPGSNGPGGGQQGGSQLQAGNDSANQSPEQPGAQQGGQAQSGNNASGGGGDGLRQFVQQLGRGDPNRKGGGPITGNGYVNWSDQLRDVEQTLDSPDLRNQLATVRGRAAVLRGEYRDRGRRPEGEVVRQQILAPLNQVRVWLREELARKENSDSLVPLDRDPVPENYSELVRKYYEKLGSAQ